MHSGVFSLYNLHSFSFSCTFVPHWPIFMMKGSYSGNSSGKGGSTSIGLLLNSLSNQQFLEILATSVAATPLGFGQPRGVVLHGKHFVPWVNCAFVQVRLKVGYPVADHASHLDELRWLSQIATDLKGMNAKV